MAVRAIENSRKSPEIARTRDARKPPAGHTGAMIGEALDAAPAVSSTNTYNYAAFDFAMGAEEINRWLAGPRRSLAEKRSAAHNWHSKKR